MHTKTEITEGQTKVRRRKAAWDCKDEWEENQTCGKLVDEGEGLCERRLFGQRELRGVGFLKTRHVVSEHLTCLPLNGF